MPVVILVNMPFAALERPSLALGLLSAILKRDGISCETLHANLLFADRVGVQAYRQSCMCKPQDLLGEWIFSPLLFPNKQAESLAYMRRFIARNPALKRNEPEALLAAFELVRNQSKPFVDELAEQILERKPSVVGCTTTFTQHLASISILKRIKELAPEVVTLLGGGNCEAEMGRATHKCFPMVDYVISGEADIILPPLIQHILEKGTKCLPAKMPPGVFCPLHRKQGYPDLAECGKNSLDARALDQLPIPDFSEYFTSLVNLSKVSAQVTPGLPVESSRGCWWGKKKGCSFCGLNGMRKMFRPKKAQTVLTEMKKLSSCYGVSRFETTDNIMDMNFHDTLMPMLKDAGAPYTIFFETKSNLERRHIKRLREAGVIWIQPGIESLDSRILKLMNKGCKAWHNIRLLKFCRQYGINVGWNLLCDFPGESDEWYVDMAKRFPLFHHLPVTNSLIRVRFDRFSPYHMDQNHYGIDLVASELYTKVYGLPDVDLADLAYFFEDRRQQELNLNPLLKALMEREGLNDCRKALYDWNVSYLADKPPRLDFLDNGSELMLTDTRPCAINSEQTLVGAERTAFLLMADGLDQSSLTQQMIETCYAEEKIETALKSLIERRIVLFTDNVWLSLALELPLPEMPQKTDFPGGIVCCQDDQKHLNVLTPHSEEVE